MVNLAKKEAIEKVIEMKQSGIPTEDIVKDLRAQGFSYKETEDALNQSELRSSSELQPSIMEEATGGAPPELETSEEVQEAPVEAQMPRQFIPSTPARTEMENVEVLIENIIEEKWKRAMETYGDIISWKEKVRSEIIAVKQELLRLRSKLENTEQAVLGRVVKYDKDIVEMGSEVKALELVLKNILKPLTSSVKDLQSITKKLKK